MDPSPSDRRILLTGASGYVGGRLLPRLEERGLAVRCLARNPEFLARRASANTEVVRGDVLEPATLDAALEGVHTAYYLIHSMGDGSEESFESLDRQAARNFADAAARAGVRRIVYLGGLGDEDDGLSAHLRSRQEVGRILRESGVPTVEFRASIVIGSGSLSFEMIRALTERLPIMITPRWVRIVAQPISISDLLQYLEAALDLEADESRIYEIGGADRISYGDLIREYARQRGLRRLMVPVPVLTPRLSSLWLGLVTPLYARVGRKLVDSISHETVVRDDRARTDFPVRPVGVPEAIAEALRNEDLAFAETRWSDALSSAGPPSDVAGHGDDSSDGFGGRRYGRRLVDSRATTVPVPPASAFAPIRRIGGENGWYAFDWLWGLRALLDLLVGGVGIRRGRPDPDDLRVGDTLDWWRVEKYEPDARLLLRAEMRLPGRAWLELDVRPRDDGSEIRQTAVFDPEGLLGLAYWYGVYPLHAVVFRGLLRGIAKAALAHDAGREGRRKPGAASG